jgi:hypothetical protein
VIEEDVVVQVPPNRDTEFKRDVCVPVCDIEDAERRLLDHADDLLQDLFVGDLLIGINELDAVGLADGPERLPVVGLRNAVGVSDEDLGDLCHDREM